MIRLACLLWSGVAACLAAVGPQSDAPFQPDVQTGLLLHLDGDAVSSDDVSATLFDGGWHHAAAVLDRERGGEVRLYLDGKPIAAKSPAYGPVHQQPQERA